MPVAGPVNPNVMRLETATENFAVRRLLRTLTVVIISCNFGCTASDGTVEGERKAIAERFFRGVYGGDPALVDELAAEDIVVSYPIFRELFDRPAIRGREATRQFARGFAERWVDARITIHDAIAEGDRVVLLWTFQARNVGSALADQAPTNEEQSWGGITLYRFDKDQRIIAEIGEESDPGPAQRVRNTADETDEPAEAIPGVRAAGSLTPEGPPVGSPVRVNAGKGCVVDIRQRYAITGTLSGSVEIDFRILVAGPCGSPAGTFDEEWIAHGEFVGTVNGGAATGSFSYVARVRVGGDVEGRIVFGQGLTGDLSVHGNFRDGSLSYEGRLGDKR